VRFIKKFEKCSSCGQDIRPQRGAGASIGILVLTLIATTLVEALIEKGFDAYSTRKAPKC
jgi:uncharacterized protein (DUF983 family)